MPSKRRDGDEKKVRKGRPDSADAFIPDPEGGPARAPDDLAEELAEEFVEAATTGEEAASSHEEEMTPEEIGGPFVETSASQEFARTRDDMNPAGAPREPFPRT